MKDQEFSIDIKNKKWEEKLGELAKESARMCGSLEIVYIRSFSDAVDRLVINLDENEKRIVLGIAEEKFDYCANAYAKPDYNDDGCCSHGVPYDCCPLGCGEF
ncbi:MULTISPECIES: hypothetical protein [unclassified Gilliamella]|uniref:hypothetical protein n=1 Tax=unclassified Gilliamella TaxID=2685620 RepID=UPI002269E2C3|nr:MULTISPECIES: hypothetical protein [unclassified Gilliamella]MCX8589121.1 hypothetical protein [Gilliamella sp. B3801]MCX8592608.1 hypothetical protein [Gilliamella sp. B3804]